MNIVPEQVTFEWVKFVRECLKRGYVAGEELVAKVLAKLDVKGNVTPFAQFICEIAESQPHTLYEHLPICISIFEKHCEIPDEFTLALSAKLINNLGEMVDPYLNTLIMTSLSIDSEYTESFIS
jgi:hypothetical protein